MVGWVERLGEQAGAAPPSRAPPPCSTVESVWMCQRPVHAGPGRPDTGAAGRWALTSCITGPLTEAYPCMNTTVRLRSPGRQAASARSAAAA